jgi:hypothetical protein
MGGETGCGRVHHGRMENLVVVEDQSDVSMRLFLQTA